VAEQAKRGAMVQPWTVAPFLFMREGRGDVRCDGEGPAGACGGPGCSASFAAAAGGGVRGPVDQRVS